MEKNSVNVKHKIIELIIAALGFIALISDIFVCIFIDTFSIGHFFVVLFMGVISLCGLLVFFDIFIKCTDEKSKRNIVLNCVRFIAMTLLDGILILSFVEKWLIAIYVIGILIIIIAITAIINNFLNSKVIPKSMLLLDLFTILAITIALICFIPDNKQNIQIIVSTIIASVYGGLITLTGVAWTIKHNDKQIEDEREKRELELKAEEIKKAKPYFSYTMLIKEPESIEQKKTCISDEIGAYVYELYVELENSDFSSFMLKRVYHDGHWYNLKGNTLVIPRAKIILNWFFEAFDDMYLEVSDLLGNNYYYNMKVITFNNFTDNLRRCYTIREINEVDANTIKDIL